MSLDRLTMALSLYEGPKRQSNWPIVFMGVNLVFAGLCIFWWSAMSLLVGDAVAWATWRNMGAGAQDFFSYPFMLLWAMPIGGSCVAWLCLKSYQDRLALVAALFPLILLDMIVVWYNLMPQAWR